MYFFSPCTSAIYKKGYTASIHRPCTASVHAGQDNDPCKDSLPVLLTCKAYIASHHCCSRLSAITLKSSVAMYLEPSNAKDGIAKPSAPPPIICINDFLFITLPHYFFKNYSHNTPCPHSASNYHHFIQVSLSGWVSVSPDPTNPTVAMHQFFCRRAL